MPKQTNILKRNWESIVVNFICSAVFAIVLWALKGMYSNIPQALRYIVDAPYYYAARMGTYSIALDLYAAFLAFSVFLLTLFVYVILDAKKKIQRWDKEAREKDEQYHEKVVIKQTEAGNQRAKARKMIRTIARSGIVLAITFSITCVFMIYTSVYPMILCNDFERGSAIVAPYISDEEMKMIKSQWALMEKKNDFDQINIKLEYIMQENNIHIK